VNNVHVSLQHIFRLAQLVFAGLERAMSSVLPNFSVLLPEVVRDNFTLVFVVLAAVEHGGEAQVERIATEFVEVAVDELENLHSLDVELYLFQEEDLVLELVPHPQEADFLLVALSAAVLHLVVKEERHSDTVVAAAAILAPSALIELGLFG